MRGPDMYMINVNALVMLRRRHNSLSGSVGYREGQKQTKGFSGVPLLPHGASAVLDMQIWICQKQQQDVNTTNPAKLGTTRWFSWCRSLLHYHTVTELTPEIRPGQIDVCHRRLLFITRVLWFIVSINNDVYKRKYITNSMTPENKLRDCLCDMMKVLNFWPHGSRFNWATSGQELICKAVWDHMSLCRVVI